MKWELIERSRIKRLQIYNKKKKKENSNEEKRKEEIFDLMILDEMKLQKDFNENKEEEGEEIDLKFEIKKYLKIFE